MRKLGINYYSGFEASCEDWIKTVKNIGFDAMFTMHTEMNGSKVLNIGEFAELASKHGLYYECIHAPFDGINAMWSKDSDGDIMLKRLTDCVEDCGKFRIPKVVVHLSSGVNAPAINDAGHKRFDMLIDCAVKNNVLVAFENQRKLANLAFVMELYENVPNVGFCWDVGHEKCFAGGREFMPLFGDRLIYTHIHDNFCNPNGDNHLIPFDGSIDYSVTAAFLNKYIGNNSLTLEVFPDLGKEGCEIYGKLSMEEFYTRAYNAATKLNQMIDNTK